MMATESVLRLLCRKRAPVVYRFFAFFCRPNLVSWVFLMDLSELINVNNIRAFSDIISQFKKVLSASNVRYTITN